MYGPCLVRRLDRIVVFAFVWMMLPGVDNNDAGNRKTYIVRYTNGEFTIPVTVVLDYKKQAEYVINMNSRSPTKSVTFYDFKQKSIAYKDMSNRECFIGRLPFETLEEENERLKDVQSPVDIQPVVLRLDSRKTSLTPTEVRNIAGQKIAMFCRKMATWLLQETNRRSRRQVDQRIEKRYKHYGRETHEYTRGGHEIYEVSYPRSSYGFHKRRRENPIHSGKENAFHPSLVVNHSGAEINPRSFRSTNLYNHPGGDPQFQREPSHILPEPKIPPGIPLYKPTHNITIHTQHRHPLRNRNTIDAGGPTSYPLRGSSVVGTEGQRPLLLGLPGNHGYHDPLNRTLNREFPHGHALPTNPLTLSYSRPLRANQVNSIQNHLPVPHYEYVHELRSAAHNGLQPPPRAIALKNSDLPHQGIAGHLKVLKPTELRGEHRFPVMPPDGLVLNKSSALLKENATVTGNDVYLSGNIHRETELGGYAPSITSQQTLTLNNESSLVGDLPRSFHPYIQAFDFNNNTKELPDIQRTYFKETSDRSDLPEEDIVLFPARSPENETKLLPHRQYNQNNYSVSNTTVQEGLTPQKKRPQNVLELFTPDEIVIDIGKIPIPANDIDVNRFQGAYANTTSFRTHGNETKYHHSKKLNPGRRKTPTFSKGLSGNRPLVHRRRIHPSTQPSHPPAVLPPGVDVHPRHPHAPYAQLASPSVKRTMSTFNVPPMPVHHQRHQRKKLRKGYGCCKQSLDQATSRCCESNQCCTVRGRRGRPSCCKNKVRNNRPFPGASIVHNTTHNRTVNDVKDMCDIKRMCRTLYQSTKAVKVCKLNDVPGC